MDPYQKQQYVDWLIHAPSNCTCLRVLNAKHYEGKIQPMDMHQHMVNRLTGYHSTRLIYATQRGCLGCVQWLVNQGDLKTSESERERKFEPSVLVRTISKNYIDILRHLLINKANVNHDRMYICSPLKLAMSCEDRTEIAHLLIDFGATTPKYGGKQTLGIIRDLISGRNHCRRASAIVLGLWRFNRFRFGGNARDIIKLIAACIWSTRFVPVWGHIK